MNIAEQILYGSSEIDRKRKVIEQLVKFLLEAVDLEKHFCDKRQPEEIVFYPKRIVQKLKTKNIRWYLYHVGCDQVYLVCKDKEAITGVDELYRSDKKTMSAWWVPDVYATLPILVQGMQENFPEVGQKLAPLLKAANY